MNITQRVTEFLDKNNISYEKYEHAPVRTSEEAARIRGEELKTGAKAMIVRSNGTFFMFVLCADRKIDWKKARALLSSKSVSLATHEEVERIAGVTPGGVPPFGNLFGIPVYLDTSILALDHINFSAGHTTSIRMNRAEYIAAVKPEIVEFSA